MSIEALIRTIPDYPKPGIMFRDITTLLADPRGFRAAVDGLAARYADRNIDKVVGIEARGFIVGAPVAHRLGVGFAPVRKKGKLPGRTIAHRYDLEYGSDTVEMHTDAVGAGERALLVDDLLATGGTAAAAAALIERLGAVVVECCFVIDLPDVGGRARLEAAGRTVFSLCAFEGH